MAAGPAEAFFGAVERVALEDPNSRIAAEIVASAPPGVPGVVPGQRIAAENVAWLTANRELGTFLLDPTYPTQRTIRCVVEDAKSPN